jgi:hypothetical protein
MAIIDKSRLAKRIVCWLMDLNEYQLDWARERLVRAPMYCCEETENKIRNYIKYIDAKDNRTSLTKNGWGTSDKA